MYIAVDIGGTKTLVAKFSDAGKIIEKHKFATNKDYSTFVKDLCDNILGIVQKDSGELKGVAIAAPGLMDYDKKIVKRFTNLPWENVNFKEGICINVKNVPVIVDNDCNFGALGEANLGAGRYHRTVLYITLSTGIGTGVTFDKQISSELAKSEGGQIHIKDENGKLVTWEDVASGKAFYKKFGVLAEDVKDPKIWKQYAEDVSIGVGSLIAVIQPDIVVIGGSMGEYLEKYKTELVKLVEKNHSTVVDIPPIVEAHDANYAVLYGCFIGVKRYASSGIQAV